MEDNEKKLNILEKVVDNLTHPSSSNIREVNFKDKPDDIIQTIGEDSDAILIKYDKDKNQITLFFNGEEVDSVIFAKKLKADTGFYALFDYIQDKFKSWSDAWVN